MPLRAFRPPAPPSGDDLGLGLKGGPRRGVNKDGTFNVRRIGAPSFRPYELYHQLIAMPLPRFFGVLLAGYLVANLLFGCLYTLIGLNHFAKASGAPMGFVDAFFFSAQTLTTVGYGHIYPIGTLASAVSAVESLVGLLAFALATGLLYGRFSRPHARVLFSHLAVVAPFRGGRAFMFRIVNERSNQLIEVEANVTLSLLDPETGNRRFSALRLERTRINLFPSNWTIVHPIDAESPLAGLEEGDLKAADAEFIILIKAFDDTFAQTVYARSSYKAEEVAWGRRFVPMVDSAAGALSVVDLRLLDATEATPIPAEAS